MGARINYPPDCDTSRAKRQYREGLAWGRKDRAMGKHWAVCGSYWHVEGYEAAHIASETEEGQPCKP